MTDLYHVIGSDLSVSAAGDVMPVDGVEKGRQRVLRRLLTNPAQYDDQGNVTVVGDVIYHPDGWAGLGRFIGSTATPRQIEAAISQQLARESAVAQSPPPTISVSQIANGLSVDIGYTDNESGQPVALSFDVNQ